jgi:hypothetical protein
MPPSAPVILDHLRRDANDAAWRTGAKQLTKLTHESTVALLYRHLEPEQQDEILRGRIANFLRTPVGVGFYQTVLAGMLYAAENNVPMPAEYQAALAKLGRELRVSAMAEVGNVVADLIMDPLRDALATFLKDVSSESLPPSPAQQLGDRSRVPRAVPVADTVTAEVHSPKH